ncbi:MAG: septum formation protein Maf [Deltaproteobacteria bacterium RIFOXYA12_FULL_61_11]|nr:MAG: septum formation protein Maf [Deltaproteobacteria bacterium RIFOXYA12_FULL_61_11]
MGTLHQHLPLVLGSSSARRRELLTGLALTFEVTSADLDESELADEPPTGYVVRMAREKAAALAQDPRKEPPAILLTADTIVVHEGAILHKPIDRDDGRRILRTLAGRWHEVHTAYHLDLWDGRELDRLVTTRVRFKRISPGELEHYLDQDEYRDKAGGYGIQGKANVLVQSLEGSYTNVIGLPLAELVEDLLFLGAISYDAVR